MALFDLPLLALWIIYYNYQNIDILIFFTLLVILFAFCINVFNLITNKTNFVIKPAVKKEFLRWRVFLRPLAIIFPLLYFYFDKKTVLIIIGAIALIFFSGRYFKIIHKKT